MNPQRLTKAARAVEDAQDDLRRYQRIRNLGVTAAIAGVAMIGLCIAGALIGIDLPTGLLMGVGIPSVTFSVIWLTLWRYLNWWTESGYTDVRKPSPYDRLKTAQRAYEDLMMEGS